MNGVGRAGRLLQESSLYVLLFLLPFSKAAVELMFGGLLVGWVLERLDPQTRQESVWWTPRLRPVAIAAAAYFLLCLLSMIWSDAPWLSAKGVFDKWLEYLLMFVITADVAQRPRVLMRSVGVLACSSIFVVIEGLTQELFRKGIFRGYLLQVYGRMTGPYENPIDLATYLMVLMPILLGYAASRRRPLRLAMGGLLLVLLGCFVRTEAAGAWLGLGVATVLTICAKPGAAFRRAGLVLLAAVAVTGGAWLYREGRLFTTLSGSEVGTVDRLAMWRAALGMIRDRPIAGHGVNTFMANYLRYWVGGERQPRYAHNCYLQVAAETGLLGLALFVGLLGRFFWQGFSATQRLARDECLLLLGFLVGLLAFVLQAGVDTNFYSLRQAALFWILAGLALGTSEHVPRSFAALAS